MRKLPLLVDYNLYLGRFKGMIQPGTVLHLTLVCRSFIVGSCCSCEEVLKEFVIILGFSVDVFCFSSEYFPFSFFTIFLIDFFYYILCTI